MHATQSHSGCAFSLALQGLMPRPLHALCTCLSLACRRSLYLTFLTYYQLIFTTIYINPISASFCPYQQLLLCLPAALLPCPADGACFPTTCCPHQPVNCLCCCTALCCPHHCAALTNLSTASAAVLHCAALTTVLPSPTCQLPLLLYCTVLPQGS
jgi:hypothetical protein